MRSSTNSSSDSSNNKTRSWAIVKVTGKKIYRGKTYYRIESAKRTHVMWEVASKCHCPELIREYEQFCEKMGQDEQYNEWEVEKIIGKRVIGNRTEYRCVWKDWSGPPTWVDVEKCNLCINLVAAYENPKLRKMYNFRHQNKSLWLTYEEMLAALLKIVYYTEQKVNLLHFSPGFPPSEIPPRLDFGLNMGCLIYENHWYLIVILIEYLKASRRILVGDPLNTLVGVDIKTHPVKKRLEKIYPSFPVTPVIMTQMNKSDTCAFCVLAAFQRALFLYDRKAERIVENIYYCLKVAEDFRFELKPEVDMAASMDLKVPVHIVRPPNQCEFCELSFRNSSTRDKHIMDEHMS